MDIFLIILLVGFLIVILLFWAAAADNDKGCQCAGHSTKNKKKSCGG